jgi:hypothetical protein
MKHKKKKLFILKAAGTCSYHRALKCYTEIDCVPTRVGGKVGISFVQDSVSYLARHSAIRLASSYRNHGNCTSLRDIRFQMFLGSSADSTVLSFSV